MSDDLRDDDEEMKGDKEDGEETEHDSENHDEADLESASEEPDFAPTSAAPLLDGDDDLDKDPHDFQTHQAEPEDPHDVSLFGDDIGSPYTGDGDDEDEEEDDYAGDSDSY